MKTIGFTNVTNYILTVLIDVIMYRSGVASRDLRATSENCKVYKSQKKKFFFLI